MSRPTHAMPIPLPSQLRDAVMAALRESGIADSSLPSLDAAVQRIVGALDAEKAAWCPDADLMRAIFDNIPVMISVNDESGRFLHVNRAWEQTLGWTLEDTATRDVFHECYPDPAEHAAVLEFLRRADRRWTDFHIRARNGAMIDASWIRFKVGESTVGIGVDIADRKRVEGERTQLLERERAARAEAEDTLDKLRAVYTITDSAVAHSGLDDLLGELLGRLRRTLAVDYATVLLLTDDQEALYVRAIDGPNAQAIGSIRLPLGKGVAGKIAVDGHPLIIYNYETIDLSGIEGTTPDDVRAANQAVMGVPLCIAGRVVGVVVVTSMRVRRFSGEELKLLQLVADRVAPAMERARLIEKIRAGRERRKRLSRRLLTAQEEERRRLAVELHDELGQILTAVKINLESLQRAPDSRRPAEALRGMIASVDEALGRVRDIALDLRPSVLDDLGLAAALRWYVDRMARAAGLEAHVSIDDLPPIDSGMMTVFFRIAQEALTNVVRHARARNVWLDLQLWSGHLELRVRDDGVGFDIPMARERAINGASIGLLGMQERVALVGGEFEIQSAPPAGVEVRARIKIAEREVR